MSDSSQEVRLDQRRDYTGEGIFEDRHAASPLEQIRQWVHEAQARSEQQGDVPEPLAMSVATVDAQGQPDVRTVLMRFLDAVGPGFVTGTTSAKGLQLADNPRIAVSLTWPSMFRAIRLRGVAESMPREDVRRYFCERPWASRISAWASVQSTPVEGREALEAAYAECAARWPDTGSPDDVPVPDRWGAYRVRAHVLEFWAGRRDRLHDRLRVEPRGPVGADPTTATPPLLDDAAAWRWHRLQP